MRKEVYTKFAEALSVKKANDRKELVLAKLAEAIGNQRMAKKAGLSPKVLTFLKGIGTKLSPELKGAKNWKKWDPRRLFTTTKQELQTANNSAVVNAQPGVAGTANGGSYAAAGGAIPAYENLPEQSVKDVTRLSPGKILAALGLTAGTGGAATAVAKKMNTPAPTPAPAPANSGLDELWNKILANKKMVAALAAAGLLTAGGVGYAMATTGKKRRPSEEY